jgi:hypothetical protein
MVSVPFGTRRFIDWHDAVDRLWEARDLDAMWGKGWDDG